VFYLIMIPEAIRPVIPLLLREEKKRWGLQIVQKLVWAMFLFKIPSLDKDNRMAFHKSIVKGGVVDEKKLRAAFP